jgi:acyl carrier protein
MLNGALTREAVSAEVHAQLTRILAMKSSGRPSAEGPREPVRITEELSFSELQVSSLQLAELISNLEAAFDVDPFAERVAITSIRTVGDLCDAYLLCAEPAAAGEDALDAELRAVRDRTLEGRGR